MKQNYSPRTLRTAGLLLASLVWLANNGNPPNGNTGAPFDSSCGASNCHGMNNTNNYNGSVTLDGLPSTIESGTVYPLTITVTPTGGNPVKAGYQMVVVNSANNQNAGDLAATNTQSGTEMYGGREYIDQRGGKTFGGNPVSWTFNWTAPVSLSGSSITFYYIANLCNGNNNSGGDYPISGSVTVPFSGPPPITASISDQTNVTCNGGGNGSATVTASGGVTPYTYHWSNNQTTQTAVNLVAGTYTVTVTGSSGSGTATAVATITAPPAITLNASVSGTLSCINQSVNGTANATGGTPPFSYEWSNGTSGNTTSFTAAGQYTVTATDNAGCTKTAVVNVTGNTTPPNAAASANGSLSCTTNTVSLSCSGSSTGPIYTLLWSTLDGNILSGSTSCNPVVNQAGTYTLVVTNTSTGCTNSASVTVTSSANPPGASATGGTLTCSVQSININASSPTAGVNFSWSGPNGFTSNVQNPLVSAPGNYVVTVTNPANNCTSTATAVVTQNITAPAPVASVNGILTCAVTSLQLSGNSGIPNATYFWTGPNGFTSNLQNPTVSYPGPYLLTVTNPVNGCTGTASVTVNQDISTPGGNASAGPVLTCVNLSSTVSANTSITGPVSYAWSGPGGFTSTLQTATVNQPGTYTVTIHNSQNGCTATASTTVQQNITPPGASATGGVITCLNATVTLSGSSNGNQPSWAWNGPGGSSTAQNFSVGATGDYTLTVTDGVNGCTSTASASVTQNTTPPVAVIATPDTLNCFNLSVQLDATGSSQGAAFSYVWSTANGNFISGITTLTPVVNEPGDYRLIVNNTENGCADTASTTVLRILPPSASISAITNVLCNGGASGSATVAANGGSGNYSYLWSNSTTTATASGLSAGTYNVTVSDADNCTATATVSITQPDPLVVSAGSTGETALGAHDGTAYATPAGGTPAYTFLWSNFGTTDTISGLAPGTYTVTVTDANGCSNVQIVTVNSFNCNITASSSVTNVSCNGGNNGSATINLDGATAPVDYEWSNGDSTATVQNLAAGAYTVQILDGAGCPLTLSVNVSEPPALAANASATGETGSGAANGTATASPTGGTQPYSYSWSNAQTVSSIQNLAPGNYTVTVTDANNCSVVQTVTVNAFNCAVSATISSANVNCYGLATGQATIVLTGGTLPYTYLWSNGANTATATGLEAGVYSVTATDAAGCTATGGATITEPTAIAAGAQITNVPCPESQTGSALLSVTGGTAPYQINWPNGSNGQNLGIGIYAVTITDANGCISGLSVPIASTDTESPGISCPGNILICGADVVNYPLPTITDNCNLDSIQPVLISGLPSGAPFNDGVTTQVYQATDASGNTATCSFNVTVNPLADIIINSTTNDVNNSGVGAIDITPVGGAGSYVFIWRRNGVFFSNSEDISGLTAGTYTLSMTDANGCGVALAPIIITNTVGTDAPGEASLLRIIPNPSVDNIQLEIEGVEVISGQIFDLRGHLVRELNDSDLHSVISVEELATGMYYLRVLSEAGKWQVLRFVKAGN